MNIPTIFVEVGSNEEEWKKQEPANIVAKSILELLSIISIMKKKYTNDILY